MRGIVYGLAGLAAFVLLGSVLGLVATEPSPWMGEHGPWYVSRAAGLTAYLLLWAGVVGGLLMSSAWFDGFVHRGRLLAMHETAAIAGLGFAALHALALIPDGWTDLTILHLLVPFTAPFDRSLNALGTLTLYLAGIVTVSFWMRSLIGAKTWRLVHFAAFVAWGGALWHGMQLGTDSRTAWVAALYALSALAVCFAVVLRLTYRKALPRRQEVPREVPVRAA